MRVQFNGNEGRGLGVEELTQEHFLSFLCSGVNRTKESDGRISLADENEII